MLLTYFPVLVIMALVTVMGVAPLILNAILVPTRPQGDFGLKGTPWECGMVPIGEANTGQFRIHFFIIAILFVVFDVETMFLFPWAVILTDPDLAILVFIEMVVFILILVVGLVYAWAKGGLDWVK